MRSDLLDNNNNSRITPDELLKAVTLIFLQDALKREHYEEGPRIVRLAKRFGADQNDIDEVIAECFGGKKVT